MKNYEGFMLEIGSDKNEFVATVAGYNENINGPLSTSIRLTPHYYDCISVMAPEVACESYAGSSVTGNVVKDFFDTTMVETNGQTMPGSNSVGYFPLNDNDLNSSVFEGFFAQMGINEMFGDATDNLFIFIKALFRVIKGFLLCGFSDKVIVSMRSLGDRKKEIAIELTLYRLLDYLNIQRDNLVFEWKD